MSSGSSRWQLGFDQLGLPDAARVAEAVERWQRDVPGDRPLLDAMAERGRCEVVYEAFREVLPFGTGGRRGRVGPGPGCLNPQTVAATARGHARWLKRRRADPSVVLAWDVRRFHDLAERWVRTAPSPLFGLSSLDLARAAAAAYLDEGVTVWWPDEADLPFVATPLLSFAVRALGADGGLNVTASHNPPDDNGVKVYDSDGVQVAPPDDQALMAEIAALGVGGALERWRSEHPGLRRFGASLLDAYHEAVRRSVSVDLRGLKVVYSPLHGCGTQTVERALREAGAALLTVPAQASPDGAFPGVPGGVANPELPEVIAASLEVGSRSAADLALVTDPDADRLGAALRGTEGWRVLDGDELAVLVLDELLQRGAPPGATLWCTAVSTPVLGRMAREAGVPVFDDLPVGFKFIGRALHGGTDPLLLGAEESHGLLLTPELGDKDAAGAALAIAAACLRWGPQGLSARLDRLFERHGGTRGAKRSWALAGETGRVRLARCLEAAARTPPRSLAGHRLVEVRHQDDVDHRLGPPCSDTDRTARALTSWVFEASLVHLRASGTEPKLKLYVHADRGHDPVALLDAAEAWLLDRAG